MPDGARRLSEWWDKAGLRRSLSRPGLIVMCSGSFRPCGDGVIVGSLHSKAAVPPDRRKRLAATDRAEELIRHHFGAYAAVLVDGTGVFGIIDPSGAGHGYAVRGAAFTIMSDLVTPACIAEAGLRMAADHEALAACIAHPPSLASAQLLVGLQPMVPGVLYRLPDLERRTLWTPVRSAAFAPDAERKLLTAVDASTAALAGARPLLQLSGGLDSAIVATSLAAQTIPATSFTFRSDDGDADEFDYARDVSRACGSDLHEITAAALPDYGRLFTVPQHATPFLYGLDDVFEDALEAVATKVDADTIVTGQGGDAVFLRTTSPLISADRLRDRGLGSAFIRGIVQDALRSRRSIWHHGLPAIKERLHRVGLRRELLVPEVLHPQRRGELRLRLHPWIVEAAALPPGRRLQIEIIASAQLFHSRRPFGATLLSNPLLAQPVLEAVLAIPSWQLADGPSDRGLARRTFGRRLPASVAHRRSKGEASARFSRAACANLHVLRERLLGGALAEASIVDVDVLARILDPEHMFYSLDYRTIAVLATCEAWLRAWR